MGRISCVKTESYQFETLKQAVALHFERLGVQIPPEAHVVLKPNLIMRADPQRAATTHPLLVEAVAAHLRELGVRRITLADSPGGLYTPGLLKALYETTGMAAAAQKWGVTLNLDCSSRTLRVEQGALCREFELITPIAQADYVINLCKLKTHCMTTLSCGVKNLFGCVPGLLKPQLHYRFPDGEQFAQMLLDLSLLVRPGLTVVDGVVGMEGDGPTGGSPRQVGCTLAAAGADLYALDLAAAAVLGLEPRQVPTLQAAIARGLCPAGAQLVEVVGDPLPHIQDFRLPATKLLDFTGNIPGPLAAVVRALRPWLTPHPRVRPADCIGCGRCAQSCPMHTISMEAGKAVIHPKDCIHCFCCHEMCPQRAIDIKTSPIFRFMSRG